MRKLEGVMLTTHVDLDGERFAIEGLQSFAASFNDNYLPLTIEHDIRRAPVGRIASAAVVPLEDGEFAVKGIFEVFEEGDTVLSLRGDGRRIQMGRFDTPTFDVECDRSYETPEGREFIAVLRQLSSKSQITCQAKKSVDPVSTLVIAVAIGAGAGIANGFFGKLGEDLYEGLKGALKGFFGKRRSERERILVFQFEIKNAGRPAQLQIVLTNPTPEDIEMLLSGGLEQWNSYLLRCAATDSAARLVFEYKDGQMTNLYILRDDCVPLRLTSTPKQ